ncbi:glycosyl hydrolase [Chitinophaga sedimenti]|uniref:glycosyl hydrolase n=1 Tax=Chitinophaga sedimenti TaxID=2033606 RepID=UPI0027E127B6|nr:glycosyl hydrolase [Chitinophaga sedimenti]
MSTHSPGGGGLAIDYMSSEAMDLQYSKTVGVLTRGQKIPALKYLHDDSWELGASNWTPAFAQEFKAANGYDIYKYLPILTGRIIDNRDVSNNFLFDFRRTIADLIYKNHYERFADLAAQQGMGIHSESGGPHPAPLDALKNRGLNAIPMGEFWIRANTHRIEAHRRLYVKQPASAAHIYGKQFAQAEGPTSIGPHWEEDFYYMKPTLDRVYCEGLNRLVIHTFTHSPEEAGKPGNEYFAGTHFNQNVTWWEQAPAFLRWNSRISYMLSRGLFVGDVCYYYGDNVPNQVPLKHVEPGLGEGYDYDVCNTDVILHRMQVKNGRIVLPDGMSYAVLVLPDWKVITPEVLQKLEQLVRDGATVIGPKPLAAAGLRNAGKDITALADKVWARVIQDKPVRRY